MASVTAEYKHFVFMVSAYLLFCQDSKRRANWKFHLMSNAETTWRVWPLHILAGQTTHWPWRKEMLGCRSQTALGILLLFWHTQKHKQTWAEIFFCMCLYSLSRKLTSRSVGLQIMQGSQLIYTNVEDLPYRWRLSSYKIKSHW